MNPFFSSYNRFFSLRMNHRQLLGSLFLGLCLLETGCIRIGGSAPEWTPETSSSTTSETFDMGTSDTFSSMDMSESFTDSLDSTSEVGEETAAESATTSDNDTGPICGNTVLEDGEECDDGNQSNEDACLVGCILPSCGDGYLHEGLEECDDGNTDNNDGCTIECKESSCGDGFLQEEEGEECDDANDDNNDGCTEKCMFPACNDGYVQDGEECDDGDQNDWNFCTTECKNAVCGDGVKQWVKGEECDDGKETATCNIDCTQAECGDGYANTIAGEECDDANTNNSDSCTELCKKPYCGDGYLQEGEECDDGDGDNWNACKNDCTRSVEAIVAGGAHTCALLKSGSVRCWGRGTYGQLGYGNTTNNIGDNETPASKGDVNVGGAVIQLVAGDNHTCALLNSNAVRCWGQSTYGKLGYGNTANVGDNETPASKGDVNLGDTVLHLVAGGNHTCAVKHPFGAVTCWGQGAYGQLGYGNTENIGDNIVEMPPPIVNIKEGFADILQIHAGFKHNCSLHGQGKVYCWGQGNTGQLGYGNTKNIGDDMGEMPLQQAVNVGGVVESLALGGSHTCALLNTGYVKCWGQGTYGQLGYGNTEYIGDNELPFSKGTVSVGGKVTQLALGVIHTCALLDTGKVRCWGRGGQGQLGYGNTNNIGDSNLPSSKGNISLGGTAIQITAGGSHTCALLSSGDIQCWGDADEGQLGYGNTENIGDNELPSSAGFVPLF